MYFFVLIFFHSDTLQKIRLTEYYAFFAISFLYLALLAGPFCYNIKTFPYRAQYLKARRALGVSAFYFAFLHALLAFFEQLGGFAGLSFLSNTYLLAISLSATALVILGLLAATSFDRMVKLLKFRRWKLLHRLVYLAGIFILFHALLLGTHFQNLSDPIPQIVFTALAFYLFLLILRIDSFFKSKLPRLLQVSLATVPFFGLLLFGILYILFPLPMAGPISLSVHSQHVQLAKQIEQQNQNYVQQSAIPGLQGDPTKRYTVSFSHPDEIQPNQDVTISLRIYDAANGNQQLLFRKNYEKFMHLIVVDESLTYYSHLHPEPDGEGFTITTQFPHAGRYHLYTDFQQFGAIEQQIGFTVFVGDVHSEQITSDQANTSATKRVGDYTVTISYPHPLSAAALSNGQQQISFMVMNAKTKQPVTTLQPYLGAFGHLVMINKKTFAYLHVHPTVVAKPSATGGPVVAFLPLGLYNPVQAGTYRLFVQFNPDNTLITADFTVSLAE